ncbi:MAG TPA: DUF1343 domain-containing protein [Gammaproteobacteria bacterium]|nr:DUF1343 domain-containing protein [Gammaproteobacteria bacterium]
MTTLTGLDLFEREWPSSFNAARVGLLVHPSSVNKNLTYAVDLFLQSKKFKVTALFGPQHGIRGETQDNMIEWEGFQDQKTALPVFSLYGKARKPTPEMLKNVDVLVIDLQDVGARYYTFIWTMALCMEACAELNKSILILDRPNPINGRDIEGQILDPHYSSFVGLRPLPIRHGMTVGEIASYLKETFYPKLDLKVIPMQGWKRDMAFDETKLPWVMPSPNMPTLDTAFVYPGMCLFEGTQLSEARGTTRPFEIFGAPFIDPDKLVKQLDAFKLPGVKFRPSYFLPTFQKHANTVCAGAQIYVTDRAQYKSVQTAIVILKVIHDLYPSQFAWKNPPYEYEEEKMPIDILAGNDELRTTIEQGKDISQLETSWQNECENFNNQVRKKFLIY